MSFMCSWPLDAGGAGEWLAAEGGEGEEERDFVWSGLRWPFGGCCMLKTGA